MNPIIDTNLLKHHRVDYGPQIDLSPRRAAKGTWVTLATVVLASFVAAAAYIA